MTRYILNQPRDPAHESQEPQFTWWRIIEHNESTSRASRFVALVQDEKHADIICSMLNDRQEARERLDLGDAP